MTQWFYDNISPFISFLIASSSVVVLIVMILMNKAPRRRSGPAIDDAILAEREACARLCEDMGITTCADLATARGLAAAIRARGDK